MQKLNLKEILNNISLAVIINEYQQCINAPAAETKIPVILDI